MRFGARSGIASARSTARGTLLPCAEWALLVALVALFVTRALLPAWGRINTDFSNYYLAARLVREGYPFERFFDWVWFQRQKDHAGIDWGLAAYGPLTPFSALVLVPFASLPTLAAKRGWIVVNVVLLAATVALMRRMCQLPLRRVALVTFLAIVPLRTNFEFGQQYVLLAFLLVLAAWLALRGRHPLAGAVVGVAAALKLYPALFVMLFVLQRRWGAVRGFFAATALALGTGVALFGVEPFRVYATSILPRASLGEIHDPYYLGGNSPTVLLRHLFVREPGQNPYPLVDAPAVYAFLQPTVQALLLVSALWVVVRQRRDRATELLLWGAFAALSLVLSTGSSTYHFCTLGFATVVALDALLAAGRRRTAFGLVVLHTLVCAPLYRFVPMALPGWNSFLGVPRMYALLAYWAVMLASISATGTREAARRWEAPVFLGLFVLMTWTGIRGASRHLAGLFDSYASRLPASHDAVVTATPAAAANGVYASRMEDEGYLLERSDGAVVVAAPRGTDLFHPAIAANGNAAFVEVSTLTSRVARFALGGDAAAAATLTTEVLDAEDPAISGDGRWLGFLREERGHGALWIEDRNAPAEPPRELVAATHDVTDLSFFPDGRVVYAARDGDHSALFVTTTTPGTPVPLSIQGRYPAVSPDGLRIAYSRLERGNWQLALADLTTHTSLDLTRSDCNSISPAWAPNGERIVYASDCGRGLGTTALCEIPVPARGAE